MLILTIFLFVFGVGNCVDYCSICKNHIACNNDGKIADQCRSKSEIINIASYKDLIVDEHNKKRNEIALGKVPKFEPALRMPTMEWDDELAKLAELNVKTCTMSHDKCHNTKLFAYSGQNLAMIAFGGYNIPLKEVFLNAINNWFNEYKNAAMSIIDKYHNVPKTGHFTVMVADRNIRVGCATIKTVDGATNKFVTACNYATTNMMGFPIYRKGPPATGCKTGANPNYPGLCSVKEQIDVNKFY